MLIESRMCFHQFINEGLKVENSLIESAICLETFIIRASCFCWFHKKTLNGPSPFQAVVTF